jgi:DNA-binding MarR family transcriptional regulator
LLALAQKVDDGPTEVTELARLAGFSLGTAYPAIRSLTGRGYLLVERRHYSLSEHGLKLVAAMDGTHREGIQTYVDRLERDERERLRTAFAESNYPPHRKEQS